MPRLTDEQLDELERLYTPADQQKCRVCGAGLEFAASTDSLTKYVCGSPETSILQHGLGAPTWKGALEHYSRSEWWDQHRADPRITALVQEVREARLPVQERIDLAVTDAVQGALQSVLDTLDAATSARFPFVSRDELLTALGPLLRQWDVQA